MVEFALIVAVFVLLLVGIFDLGRGVYAYHTLNNAAREAGRHAIVNQTVSDIQAVASGHAVALGVAPDDVQVSFIDHVSGGACTDLGTAQVIRCSAVVQVPYDYNAATPLIGNLVGVIQMAGETSFRIESNCQEPTSPQCPLGD